MKEKQVSYSCNTQQKKSTCSGKISGHKMPFVRNSKLRKYCSHIFEPRKTPLRNVASLMLIFVLVFSLTFSTTLSAYALGGAIGAHANELANAQTSASINTLSGTNAQTSTLSSENALAANTNTNKNTNTNGNSSAIDEKYLVSKLMLQYDVPDAAGVYHYLDETYEPAEYRPLTITEKGKTVQLNTYYQDYTESGREIEAADTTSQLGEVDIKWEIIDPATGEPVSDAKAKDMVATVSLDGLVTPLKNGTVQVRATCSNTKQYDASKEAPSKTVSIVFDGQEGEYVGSVSILDEDGKAIGSSWGGITVLTEENHLYQFYVEVTWVDGSGNVTRTQSTKNGDVIDSTVKWSVGGNTESFDKINEDTGRLHTTKYGGNGYIACSVVGGLGGATITDTANLQLDTGQYHYNPANSLTLQVTYEQDTSQIVSDVTLSYDELMERLPRASMYGSDLISSTMANGKQVGTITARGWFFKDVVSLAGVDTGDIARFSFVTADGYDNPFSYDYLFSENRYFFPNLDIGSKAESKVVAPILAYESAQEWGTSQPIDETKLDSGNRFRLVFGCLWDTSIGNSSYQIYYINTIRIILKGSPPAPDPTPTPTPSDSGQNATVTPGKDGGTGGSGTGGGTGGNGGAGGNNGARGSVAGGGVGQGDVGGTGGTMASDLANPSDAGKAWRIYQMMSNSNSNVDDWDFDNPLSPFAAPGAIAAVCAGAVSTYIGYRRRLGQLAPAT